MKIRLKKHELLFHLAFWLGLLVLLTPINAEIFGNHFIILRILCAGFLYVVIVYFNLWYLLPKFFLRKKYLTYTALLLLSIAVITPIRAWVDYLFLYGNEHLPIELLSLSHYASIVLSLIVIIGVTASFDFIQDHYENQKLQQELKNYKLEAELKFLKSQVNPHFLFNTLNNIYSLVRTKSDDAAPMVMKLSEMMRYMLYESEGKKVQLDKEIKYLENYIELQQLKTDEPLNVELKVDGEISGVEIEPMIFIPLLENSFKHSDVDDTQNGWIKAQLSVSADKITFDIRNSFKKQEVKKDSVGGIGLDNVKKRLEMLYPGKHRFESRRERDNFIVQLEIDRR